MALQVAPELTTQLTMFGTWYCPYVHRVWMSLLEKGIPFKWVEIDLQNKPVWFKEVNPLTKVPVIGYKDETDTHIINESLTLLEFLEDYQPSPSLLPTHAAQRAHARNLINWFGDKVIGVFYDLLRATDKESCHKAADGLNTQLEILQSKMSPEGPYFLGSSFSIVDAAILPWLLRVPLLTNYRGYDLPDSLAQLKQYIKVCQQKASVAKSMIAPDGDYFEVMKKVYEPYGHEPVNYFA